MKRLSRIFLLSTIVLSLSSCGHEFGGSYREGEGYIELQLKRDSVQNDMLLNNTFGPKWTYMIAISFKDVEGNDLVAPLAEERWQSDSTVTHWAGYINPDKFHIDVIYSNPPDWFDNDTYNNKAFDGMIPDVNVRYCTLTQYNQPGSSWYLVYGDGTYIETWGEDVRNLTLKITCPTIFGDNEIHELATYWDEGEERRGEEWLAKCTKLVFEGHEYVPVKNVRVNHLEVEGIAWDSVFVDYLVDIVIDK